VIYENVYSLFLGKAGCRRRQYIDKASFKETDD